MTQIEKIKNRRVNSHDKIVVHAPEKSSGHRRQKIEIYYKAIGITNIADDEDLVAMDGRGQWRKNTEPA